MTQDHDTNEYLHASEHAKILIRTIRASFFLTIKGVKNDPIYWRLRWSYFHSVMGTKFLVSVGYQKLYHELILYGWSGVYPFQTLLKPFVYWGTVSSILLLCMTTPTIKTPRKTKQLNYLRLQGFCVSRVILSCYMYCKEFSGYLRKVGQLPTCISEDLHRFGTNATYFMGLLCNSSVGKLKCRWKKIFRIGTYILLVGQTKGKHMNRSHHSRIPSQTKYEDRVRPDCLRQNKPNFTRKVSDDSFFRLNSSRVVDYATKYPPAHNLEPCHNNSVLGTELWEQWDTDRTPLVTLHDNSDLFMDANIQLIF